MLFVFGLLILYQILQQFIRLPSFKNINSSHFDKAKNTGKCRMRYSLKTIDATVLQYSFNTLSIVG